VRKIQAGNIRKWSAAKAILAEGEEHNSRLEDSASILGRACT
jgi:hypothetical protein